MKSIGNGHKSTLFLIAILQLSACKSSAPSVPPNDRAVILKALGIALPADARNIQTFELSLMSYNLWTLFEVRDSDLKSTIATERMPSWDALKTPSPVGEEMFTNVIEQVPAWWSRPDLTKTLAGEQRAKTKGNYPTRTRACVIDLGDGYWRFYVQYSED